MYQIAHINRCVLGIAYTMSETVKKFKESLDNVRSIVLRIGKTDDLVKIISAGILHKLFILIGKQSNILLLPENEKTKQFVDSLLGEIENSPPEEQLAITINTLITPVSELKYEKEGDNIKIILEGSDGKHTEGIQVIQEQKPVDFLILIDTTDQETEVLRASAPHRDIIKISSRSEPLEIKVAQIVFSILEKPPQHIIRPLWYLLDRLYTQSPFHQKELVPLMNRVIACGVDPNFIVETRNKLLGNSFWKLFGRTLARSDFERNTETLWTFLQKTDLQKTNQTRAEIPLVYGELKKIRPEARFIVILWGEKNSIIGLIGSTQKDSLQKLADVFSKQTVSDYFLVEEFASYSEAELTIRSAIQKVY